MNDLPPVKTKALEMGGCSPGSNPHSDRPNWQPAENIADYLANCREGLEKYSDSRTAKLLGWSRSRVWRAKLMAAIPDDIFDELLKLPGISERQLAAVGRLLLGTNTPTEVECCPHCGGVLRQREGLSPAAADVLGRGGAT